MDLPRRKDEHLRLCALEDVEHERSTLLEEVHLFHESLPDLGLDEIHLGGALFGRQVRVPLLISGMTGGTSDAARANLALAAAAQKHGVALGLGSQRAMLRDPDLVDTYAVRDVAPDIPILANLGLVQAVESGPEAVLELARAVAADAVCIHLNGAQELVQDDGDRSFRGGLDCLEELEASLPIPLVVKETGCGFAPRTLERLAAAGITWVDVSGAGGTSWTRVESLRGSMRQQALGRALAGWGIPTAASVVFARRAGLRTIASGGLRDGLDVARALSLGAEVAAMALPFLRALRQDGPAGLSRMLEEVTETLRAVLLLTGSRDVTALQCAPRVVGRALQAWIGDEPSRIC